jgi:hypothetical protein
MQMSHHQERRPESRRVGHPHVVVNIDPRADVVRA